MTKGLRVSGVDYEKANDPKYKAKSKDPGWKYAYWPERNKDKVKCILCGNVNHGGIKRLKQHLIGGFGDIHRCPNTTLVIAKEMREAMDRGKKSKDSAINPSSRTASAKKKLPFQFLQSRPKDSKSPNRAPTRKRTKEDEERVRMDIANFFYENGIPFNAANSKSYKEMIEAVGQYGPGFKPPTAHELRSLVPVSKTANAHSSPDKSSSHPPRLVRKVVNEYGFRTAIWIDRSRWEPHRA